MRGICVFELYKVSTFKFILLLIKPEMKSVLLYNLQVKVHIDLSYYTYLVRFKITAWYPRK